MMVYQSTSKLQFKAGGEWRLTEDGSMITNGHMAMAVYTVEAKLPKAIFDADKQPSLTELFPPEKAVQKLQLEYIIQRTVNGKPVDVLVLGVDDYTVWLQRKYVDTILHHFPTAVIRGSADEHSAMWFFLQDVPVGVVMPLLKDF